MDHNTVEYERETYLKSTPSSFISIVILRHFIICLPFILILIWIFMFEEMGSGLGSSGLKLFNWHPVLMILAFGVFMSEGVIAWRSTDRKVSKTITKRLHIVYQTLMFALSIAGLIVVVVFHNQINTPHLYSLHSWMGIAIVSLAWLQYCGSAILFGGYFNIALTTKEMMIPYHKVGGKFLYAGSVATMATGLMQKQSFVRNLDNKYEGVSLFANFIALALFFKLALVIAEWNKPMPRRDTSERDTTTRLTID